MDIRVTMAEALGGTRGEFPWVAVLFKGPGVIGDVVLVRGVNGDQALCTSLSSNQDLQLPLSGLKTTVVTLDSRPRPATEPPKPQSRIIPATIVPK